MKYFALSLIGAAMLTGCVNYSSTTASTSTVETTSSESERALVMDSQSDFTTTTVKLVTAIESRGLHLFTVVDHGGGAQSVGVDIGQSQLFIFGNPKSGSPLMLANRRFGLELPMKVLVFTDTDGTVRLARTDIRAAMAQYGIAGQDELIGKVEMALEAIAREAAS